MFLKPNAHLELKLPVPEESRVELFLPEPSSSSPNTVVRYVEPTKRLKCAILIASTTVSGVLGLPLAASFLVRFLLDLPDKIDKNIPAKFNIFR
jgi:hypothetical protein